MRGVYAILAAAVLVCSFSLTAQSASFTGLGFIPGGSAFSSALDMSADGSVVVGYGSGTFGPEAFRRTSGGGMQGLGDLPGSWSDSMANGVSANGNVIVGRSRSGSGYEAFRWTVGGGMQGLGDLPGGDFTSTANAASGDGRVIVGSGESSYFVNGYEYDRYEAFRWTSSGGMQPLGDLGTGYGSNAYGISSDGNVIVGRASGASGNEAFR